MPLYFGSGNCIITHNISTIPVNLKSILVSSIIPSGCSLKLKIYDNNTSKILADVYLSNGNNTIQINKFISSIKIIIDAVSSMVETPTWSIDFEISSSSQGIIYIEPNTTNSRKIIKDKMNVFGIYNGSMIYFPDGCMNKVFVKLATIDNSEEIPSNTIFESDGITGDGEIKYISMNQRKLHRGETLIAIVSNYDDEPHTILVYPEIELGSGYDYAT